MLGLKQFVINTRQWLSEAHWDKKYAGLDLYRQSKSDPTWHVYVTRHDEHGVADIWNDYAIPNNITFNDALNILVASGIRVHVHAYYFQDLYF